MSGESIAFVLSNLPAFLFVGALLIAAFRRSRGWSTPERFLSWILLLAVGVTGLSAAVFHLWAAELIGWQTSPFQFEVGMADLAIGTTAFVSFWCSLSFKAAAVWVSSIFLAGDAVGHFHQMLAAGNFAPGNASVPLFMDIICPLLSIGLLVAAWPERRTGRSLRGFTEAIPRNTQLLRCDDRGGRRRYVDRRGSDGRGGCGCHIGCRCRWRRSVFMHNAAGQTEEDQGQ